MHATKTLDEADRLMTVCNSCRYCEGLCAVFPAMEMRRAFSYAIVALIMGVRAFWRDIGEPIGMKADAGSIWQAIRDAGELRYLDGGGGGCFNEDDRPTDRRKLFHHFTFYGFLLCFASTC